MAISFQPLPDGQGSAQQSKDFYTPQEVAQFFGVTAKTISNWCDAGRLPYIVTAGGHRRIPVSALKGGREYQAKFAAFAKRMQKKADAAGVHFISDEAVAEEVLARKQP